MERVRNKKITIYLIVSVFLLLIVFVLALLLGQYKINISSFVKIITAQDNINLTDKTVILNIRLPRTIVAGLVGIGLAVSGLIYQEVFQNKLVSPDFLGVSSGAGVGACFAILLGITGIWICCFSFAFGILAMVLTLILSKSFRNNSPTILLLSGIIISGLMDASISFIKFMADSDNQLGEITYWLLGSFSKVTMNEVYIIFPIILICISILFSIRWRINVVSLGKDAAETKGLNYNRYMLLIIVVVTILTSISVSFCGIVGWIGLVIPQFVRLLVGRNTVKSIPLTIMIGAVFMIICDIISRTFTFSEIPLSAVTGFLGTPIFITLLFIKRGSIYD